MNELVIIIGKFIIENLVIILCAPWFVLMFWCVWEYSFKDFFQWIVKKVKERKKEGEQE